ncbi:MAG: hypothetical protein WC528_05470 [Patescibacteria group bacterium]
MPKKKVKDFTRQIPVFKVEEKKEEEKRDNQVKSLADYKPAIAKMYQDKDGKPLNLTKLEKVKKGKKSFYLKIIGLLLLLFAVSLAGFFVFFRDKKFKEGDVALNVTGVSRVASGEEITLTVQYLNQGQAFLGNLELSVTYPEGFTFKSADPEADNTYNQYWRLRDLGAGKGGEVKITGLLMGEVGSQKSFSAKLSYKPSNFNSTFNTETSFSTAISSSNIGLEIEGGSRVIPEKETTYKIKYKNDSSEALERIRLVAVYPDGFTPASANPNFSEGKNTWQIDRLEAGNTGEIELKGVFVGAAGDMKEIKFTVGLIGPEGEFNPQVEKSLLVLLISPELTLELKINGSDENAAVDPGETLTYYLLYQNNSDLELKDVTLTLELDDKLLDFSTFADDLKGKVSGQSITWTKDQIDLLSSLKPASHGEITFKINLKEKLALNGSEDKNFQFISQFKGQSSAIEGLGGGSLAAESNAVTLKVNTVAELNCETRYYSEENEALGTGPLPPVVGQTTTYRVYWYLTNTSNELLNVTVVSTLPADIYWTGQNKVLSAGDLSFAPATRQVTWTVNKIPVGTGQIYPQLSASFEVSTTPVAADGGFVKILTDQTNLQATDSFTEQTIKANCDSLTTDLKNDINAQGKGIVTQSQ